MYEKDLKYLRNEKQYIDKASFLVERGYISNKSIDELAYEIFVKEKNDESQKSKQ